MWWWIQKGGIGLLPVKPGQTAGVMIWFLVLKLLSGGFTGGYGVTRPEKELSFFAYYHWFLCFPKRKSLGELLGFLACHHY